MSKMTEICTCCIGCSQQGSRTTRYGFPKRLLIATSVVVIIAMCLTPAEARAVKGPIIRTRHHRNMTLATKDMPASMRRPKNPTVELFRNATRKITKKVRNTKRFFDQGRKVLNETKEYRDGKAVWLPKVNFVDIHSHDYKSSRKGGASITERKFTYLMPKLYKSLKEYEVIFKRLNNVLVEFPDEKFYTYKIIRQKLIESILHHLYSTIAEIAENMYAVNMRIPHFDENGMKHINLLEMKVDASQCSKNDYMAFRGYGNLLNNWNSEFRCLMNKKKCKEFEAKLNIKRVNRGHKTNRANHSLSS